MIKYNSIDEYIGSFPDHVQVKLQQVRNAIKKAAPQAEEAIKYGIPTFILNGNVVHFGGYKNHIGFYPAPTGIELFKKEFAPYKTSKGTVQFPLDEPMPLALIEKITKYRVQEQAELQKRKAAKKKKV